MAYLLGSKTCIDSLRIDINDLQNVIYDIIGKTGSIKCHSWKFPDKLATDVDINELLERYQYGKNEVDNQVSHVILFELIIDRLLLVLHGSWRYLHEIQIKLLPNIIDSSSTINQQTSLSIGLVVKKYWNKLLHIFTTLQQHQIRSDDIEKINHKRTKSNLTSEKHCQTIHTSFSPCSSCTKLQEYFRYYSDNIINLCNIYNLPSSLAYHRCSTSSKPEWLSLDDINQWYDYQIKDFDRLSKYFNDLNNTLNKTKNDFDLNEKYLKEQNEKNHYLEKLIQDEKESKKNLQEIYENKFIQMKKEFDQLIIQKNNFEQELKKINDQCISKDEQLKQLESSKNELKILTDDRIKSDELIKSYEQNRIRLQTELDILKRDLDERHQDLKRERLRIETFIRQEENSQSKQKTLIKSYEDLSEEYQLFKKQIIELEFQRDQLQKTNHDILQEITFLQSNINQLHQQINELEQKSKSSQISSLLSDKLVNDMQNQMKTYEQRIDLLQKENDSLKSSLEKFLILKNSPVEIEESYRQYSQINEIKKSKPTPLWLLNNEILEKQQAFTETKPMITTNSIPHINENDRIKSNTDVPRTITSTISQVSIHEVTLDNGQTKRSNRPLSFEHTRRNNSTSRTRHSSATNLIYRCKTCNKSYNDKRSYDLHKLYCRT